MVYKLVLYEFQGYWDSLPGLSTCSCLLSTV